MSLGRMIRLSIALVIATLCCVTAGCGEHADPVDGGSENPVAGLLTE